MESASLNRPHRLIPLDFLRGLILILMAIDHANYFVARMHPTGEFWGIPLPQYSNMAEFLTRFVTHICAPGFFFLMGAGMVFFAHSRRSLDWAESKIVRHLVIRGLLLIFLQFSLENPAWILGPVTSLNPPGAGDNVWIHIGVLACLGGTMVIGTFFLRLHTSLLLILSTMIMVGIQFFVPDSSQATHLYPPLIRTLYIPGRTGIFQSFYPIIPWLGIVLFGMAFGKWLLKDRDRAYRKGLLLGGTFIALFFIIRILGGFGNIHPPAGSGFISFMNVTKYPPSLSYAFWNIGLCLVLLWIFSKMKSSHQLWRKPFLVYGRASLFFYISHLYIFAIIGLFFASQGGSGLAVMYPIWLAALGILYPLCHFFRTFKKKKPLQSLWRLF